MNVRTLTDEWADDWDRFCHRNSDAWFWHTTDWLEYQLSYNEDINAESLSLHLTYAKEIQGICPLVLTDDGGHRELSFGGAYGPAPVVGDETRGINRETATQRLFEEIERLARNHDVARVAFTGSPLALAERRTTRCANPFRAHGYLDTSVNTRLVEVSQPTDDLWDGLRESYQDEIEATKSKIAVNVFEQSTASREIFDSYQELHRKDAGRQTRPQQTFEMMYDWLTDGRAFLVGATRNGSFIEFAYFLQFKDNVYYASAASDPEVTGLSSGHCVLWTAIEWMSDQGHIFCDLGNQYYTQQVISPSNEKERDISFYKRGFGGSDASRFRGEKFFDEDYFEKTYRENVAASIDGMLQE